MSFNEYIILSSTDRKVLESEIGSCLSRLWFLVGGLCVTSHDGQLVYSQAMATPTGISSDTE